MNSHPLVSLLVAVTLSTGGWAARALTTGGAIGASLVGTAVLAGAGWPGAAVLGAFFILSSAVGRVAQHRGARIGEAKGERRDAWQVLANGGPAAVGAMIAGGDPGLALWVVTGSLAAAGADTWATAVGGLSPRAPRLLLFGRRVPAGTSGGMTLLGTAGAAVGAATIGLAGGLSSGMMHLAPWSIGIGVGGMVFDSLLGAAAQGRFHCPSCDLDSELPVHRCGGRTAQVGGMAWLTNDGVNAATTTAGAIAGWLVWRCAA